MSKGTSCKDAIKKWEETIGTQLGEAAGTGPVKATEAEDVRLCPITWQMPLIEKMDASLSTLKKCRHLRLSSNSIDKISSLSGMGVWRRGARARAAHCAAHAERDGRRRVCVQQIAWRSCRWAATRSRS